MSLNIRPAHLRQTFQDKSLVFASAAEASLDYLMFTVWSRIMNGLPPRISFLSPFSKWFTEIYFISHFFIQMSYLKQFGATFSEHFFGLKRTSLKNKGNCQLSNREVLLSSIFVSLVRYLMEKTRLAKPNFQKQSFMNYNALINTIYCVASTVQYIRFLSGKSDVVTPHHLAAGVKLEYRNDAVSQVTGNTLRNLISQALQNGLGLSIFFLQFSQWWRTEQNGTRNRVPVPPPPPPPPTPVEHEYDVGSKCLLCGLKMKDFTLSSLCGHIFCYNCISDFVEKFKKCPITNAPAEISQLIQLQEKS